MPFFIQKTWIIFAKWLNKCKYVPYTLGSLLQNGLTNANYVPDNLTLPRIPLHLVYYKRQLRVYNSGVHSESDDVGHCYVVEREAGRGGRRSWIMSDKIYIK